MAEVLGAVRRCWHQLIAAAFELLLQPLGVDVGKELPVVEESPRLDMRLLRKGPETWDFLQRKWLPDGIRDCHARHIVIELKYKETINTNALIQTLMYDYLYVRKLKLKPEEYQTFLVSCTTPRASRLELMGYRETEVSGVYTCSRDPYNRIIFIDVNGLEDTSYNAPLKMFASKRQEKEKAFHTLGRVLQSKKNMAFRRYAAGIEKFWEDSGGTSMEQALNFTTEQIQSVGRNLIEFVLNSSPPEERLQGLTDAQRLQGLSSEVRLQGLSSEVRLEGLSSEVRLEGLSSEVRLEGLSSEVRLEGIPNEQLLECVPEEERLDGVSRRALLKKAFPNLNSDEVEALIQQQTSQD